MDIDWFLTAACFGIGIVVGLTGMGGGALMTPVLVLFFNIPPLTAVSSDLAAAAVMKPVGSFVHLRHGTVNLSLVKWLCLGSIPAAFSGVFIIRALGNSESIEELTKTALGFALLIAATGLTIRAYMRLVQRARKRDGHLPPEPKGRPDVVVRVIPTIILGVIGGVMVGMTSVGSGSLIIIALMALCPTLRASELVGTDLAQAVPLVASAALAHVFYGDFQLSLTTSLLIGSLPGVWIGAHLSSRAPGGIVRRALAFVLLASSFKLLGLSNQQAGLLLGVLLPTWLQPELVAQPVRERAGLRRRDPVGDVARRAPELASVVLGEGLADRDDLVGHVAAHPEGRSQARPEPRRPTWPVGGRVRAP
ncbi:MAG TPA: sulfite exporter TauE/SafE family protein [Candidatus Lustribacter sp.]|nr:sulfite exporter TauE/SafE family protein [Candidatus Lustribacter sp.]